MGSIYFFGTGMQVNRSEIESGRTALPTINSSLERYERLMELAQEHSDGAEKVLERARRDEWDPSFFRSNELNSYLQEMVRRERPGIAASEAREIASNISGGLYEAYMSLDPHAKYRDVLDYKIDEMKSPDINQKLKNVFGRLKIAGFEPDDIVAIELADNRDLDLSKPEHLCQVLEEFMNGINGHGPKHKLHTIDTLATIPRTSPTHETNVAAVPRDPKYMAPPPDHLNLSTLNTEYSDERTRARQRYNNPGMALA